MASPGSPYFDIFERFRISIFHFPFTGSIKFDFKEMLPITNDIYCEAQGKGRARGGPRKVTQRSFMDGGWPSGAQVRQVEVRGDVWGHYGSP